jgi:taurine--2-oxoglutarate transaminase
MDSGTVMKRDSKEIIQENRDYTMFSWSVQAASNPIHMVKGKGVWFWDGDGNQWLDFSSQLINLNIGHQHPKMLEAIKAQVDELCFAGPGFAHEPRGALGKKLAEVTGLAKSFFTLGGSEANENAMKIAPIHRPRQDHFALPFLSRRHHGQHDRFRRSAPLAGRARHSRRRTRL